MSKFVHKVNRGSLFVNEERKTEKHAHFRGTVNVNGAVYWIKAWNVEPEDGKKLPALNLSLTKQEGQATGDVGDTLSVLLKLVAAAS
jgi:hypothetical protein